MSVHADESLRRDPCASWGNRFKSLRSAFFPGPSFDGVDEVVAHPAVSPPSACREGEANPVQGPTLSAVRSVLVNRRSACAPDRMWCHMDEPGKP